MQSSIRRFLTTLVMILVSGFVKGQEVSFQGKTYTTHAVTASVAAVDGKKAIRVERDLSKLPFDVNRLESTVDEPTFIKLKDVDFENGTIEVKVLSRIQDPSPFASAQGFIGIAFRVNDNNSAYESIYLRPKVGRSENQAFRNHTVQYYAYPDLKFDTLRKLAPMMYESSAPVNINEWITLRIEVQGKRAELFVNNAKYSSLVVSEMKGKTTHGAIGLWVDIATIGYFRDLKVTRK